MKNDEACGLSGGSDRAATEIARGRKSVAVRRVRRNIDGRLRDIHFDEFEN